MPRKNVTSDTILEGLRQDVLWLLIAIYSFMERAQLEGVNLWSWRRLGTELVLLESVVRDITLRIVALDDSSNNSRSFQTLFTAMKREGLDPVRIRKIDSKVKGYRKSVNRLKVSHRNSYIAHVGTEASVHPRVVDDPVDFTGAAAEAVSLLDYMGSKIVDYHFCLGNDLKIDLRIALQKQPVSNRSSR